MSIIGDIYEGGAAKPVSWHKIGDTVEGEVLGIRSKQLTRFGTEVPETWPNGEPKMTPVVTVQTTTFEDDDDDGRRDIYLRNNLHTAFGKALREAYKHKPSDNDLIGATLKMQFFKTEPSGKGQPRKLFRARITPRSTVGDSWDEGGPEQPASTTPTPPPPRQAAPVNGVARPAPEGAKVTSDMDIPF